MDPGYVLAYALHARGAFQLPGGHLESQFEKLLSKLGFLEDLVLLGHIPHLGSLHASSLPNLFANFDLMQSLCAARRIASWATSSVTPSIS